MVRFSHAGQGLDESWKNVHRNDGDLPISDTECHRPRNQNTITHPAHQQSIQPKQHANERYMGKPTRSTHRTNKIYPHPLPPAGQNTSESTGNPPTEQCPLPTAANGITAATKMATTDDTNPAKHEKKLTKGPRTANPHSKGKLYYPAPQHTTLEMSRTPPDTSVTGQWLHRQQKRLHKNKLDANDASTPNRLWQRQPPHNQNTPCKNAQKSHPQCRETKRPPAPHPRPADIRLMPLIIPESPTWPAS